MSSFPPSTLALDGTAFAIGVVAARYNPALVEALLADVLAGLSAAGVKPKKITLERVPGSHETPFAAQAMLAARRCDCVIALGVLLAGDTKHHEMVGQSVSHALQAVSLAARTPVINGVIVANTLAQARARCVGKAARGGEFARAALEMAALKRRLSP
jgi:6,7-dimethyl-8-ribityllumazine synthase